MKYEAKSNAKVTPGIYSIENLENAIEPFLKVPDREDLNTPFILSY